MVKMIFLHLKIKTRNKKTSQVNITCAFYTDGRILCQFLLIDYILARPYISVLLV